MAEEPRQRSISAALKAAKAGILLDRKQISSGAAQHFETAIAELDEELNGMDPSSLEFGKKLRLRRKYEGRLRLAAKLGNTEEDAGGDHIKDPGNGADQQPQSWVVASLEMSDEEMTSYEEAFNGDPLPSSMASMSYWNLRRIRDAVVKGGLLNKNLLFPRQAWYSKKARFSGVAAKISFLKDIASVITVHLEPLLKQYIPRADGALDDLVSSIRSYRGMQSEMDCGNSDGSEASSATGKSAQERDTERLVELVRVLTRSRDSFVVSQNQLAKSFHFIEEEEEEDSGDVADARSRGGAEDEDTGLEGGLPPPPMASQEKSGAGGLVASLGSLGMGLGSSLVGGMGKGLTEGMSMVGNLGKNVKKIAEVGLSRINASVSSSISEEERRIYTNLVVDITERSQLFDVWYRYFEGYRSLLLEKGQGRGGDSEEEPTSPFEARQLELTESALTSLLMVSKFFKEVVCSLLLRELEELLKSFVKAQLALALSIDADE